MNNRKVVLDYTYLKLKFNKQNIFIKIWCESNLKFTFHLCLDRDTL